tara:strand:- start:154 stop:564 length:411 start_codon:yes stop_codon:yes gene_type:complete
MSSSQPNLWGFDPNQIGGKVGNAHPETSQTASLRVKSGTQKAQAILSLGFADPDGLTAYELSTQIFNGAGQNLSANQTATRLGELREQGLAVYLFDEVGRPVERETTPGNSGIVHILSRYGHEVKTDLKLANRLEK